MKNRPSPAVGDFSLRKSESMLWSPIPGPQDLRSPGTAAEKNFFARGSAQGIEKARFGEGSQRKSKVLSLIFFAQALPGLAGFG
jgi:hypothetical protein